MRDICLWNLSFILAVFVALSGCVIAVAPIVTESDATFDAGLLGRWESADGSEYIVVASADETGYAIEVTDNDGKSGRLEARLGSLGEHLILDVWPAWPEDSESDLASGLLVQGHMPIVLRIEADTIHIAELDSDVLSASLRAGEVSFPHMQDDDRLILKAATDDLRRDLTAYLERDGVLIDAPTLHRVPER